MFNYRVSSFYGFLLVLELLLLLEVLRTLMRLLSVNFLAFYRITARITNFHRDGTSMRFWPRAPSNASVPAMKMRILG